MPKLYSLAIFEFTLHIGDINEVTRFIVFADLKVFLPYFSGEMVGITLNSNQVFQIHIKKSLCAKFEVTFVSLV